MPKRKRLTGDQTMIEKTMKSTKKVVEYRRLQCIYLADTFPEMTAKEIGVITQLSESRVWAIHAAYRRGGDASISEKRGGRYRENLAFSEEQEFLKQFEEQSASGKLIEVSKIKAAYEEKIERKTAKSTIYRMLERHGFGKVVPYKRHPKANTEEQEAFKKTSRK